MTRISPSRAKVKVLYYKFTPAEVKAIYRLFEHEWVTRDDDEVWQVTQKISQIVADELGSTGS